MARKGLLRRDNGQVPMISWDAKIYSQHPEHIRVENHSYRDRKGYNNGITVVEIDMD